jgi:hypothetical protein
MNYLSQPFKRSHHPLSEKYSFSHFPYNITLLTATLPLSLCMQRLNIEKHLSFYMSFSHQESIQANDCYFYKENVCFTPENARSAAYIYQDNIMSDSMSMRACV